jgi:hypothetical protein
LGGVKVVKEGSATVQDDATTEPNPIKEKTKDLEGL